MASNYQEEQESEATSGSPSRAGETAISPRDLGLVLTTIISVAAMWYNIGLALSIEEDELRTIREDYNYAKECLRETISCWLRNCDSPSWELLVEALCSPCVKCRELAETIRSKYCPHYRLRPTDPVGFRQDSSQSQLTSPTGTGQFLEWKEGKSALKKMCAPISAVVHGVIAYFRKYRSRDIFSFNCQTQEWKRLPDCCVDDTSLVMLLITVDNRAEFALFTIGGIIIEDDRTHENDIYTNALFQLQLDETAWIPSSAYPKMPTERSQVTAVYTDQMLIAAGGRNCTGVTTIVEVLHITNDTWCRVADLPRGMFRASGCVIQQKLFILGGCKMSENGPKSLNIAYEVDLSSLKVACTTRSSSHVKIDYKKIMPIPLRNSTFVSVSNQFILAIGGAGLESTKWVTSSMVYLYYPPAETWHPLQSSSLSKKRSFPFSVTFDKGQSIDVVVVGGYTTKPDVDCTASVEIATLTKDSIAKLCKQERRE